MILFNQFRFLNDNDLKHVKFPWTDTIQAFDKFENLKFLSYFFNKDISFNISLICLKLSTHVD